MDQYEHHNERKGAWRGFRAAIRRRGLLLLATMCILSSALLLTAPALRRIYRLSGTMTIAAPASEVIPGLGQAVESVVQEAQNSGKNVSMTVGAPRGDGMREITLTTAGPMRDAAFVAVHDEADRVKRAINEKVETLIAQYRGDLQKQADRVTEQESTLSRQVDDFRLSHRSALADDVTSVATQFETLKSRLEEKQQRLKLVTEQIGRLEEYQRNKKVGVEQPVPQPLASIPAAIESTGGAAKPENDAEVVALTAQLQLINDQLEEQTGTMRRTEQHPYVVDLRAKQGEYQKKLEAAKQRALAGQPAPANVRMPTPKAPAGTDPTLVAAQQVDLQIESLRAERDSLDMEVKAMAGRRDAMQPDVDGALPVRQQYEKLTQQLAAVQKEKLALVGRREEFEKRFGTATNGEGVQVGALAMNSGAELPAFPRLPAVYLLSLLLGAGAAWVCAWALDRMDRTVHSSGELAKVAEIPVLGKVMELRTQAERRRLRLWHSAGKPVVAAGLFLVLAAAGWMCFRHLSDPAFPEQLRQRGTMTLFSMAGTGDAAR